MNTKILSHLTAGIAALILLQTLFFKFTGHPDSVHIFQTLGVEPFGRIGLGIVELITAILLIYPRTRGIGGLLGVGILSGALFSHLAILGIEVQGDGGTLFILAVVTFLASATVAWLHRSEIPVVKGFFPVAKVA